MKRPPANFIQGSRNFLGFSLIEVLVSVAVLAILVVLMMQVINSASSSTTSGGLKMDAESQARLVMDRLAFDVSEMPVREDIDLRLGKNPGDDEISFYLESPGFPSAALGATPRELSVVGYRLDPDTRQLERGLLGLPWNGMVFSGAGTPLTGEPPSPSDGQMILPLPGNQLPVVPNPDFDILGEQVVRFEIAFLIRPDGSASGSPTTLAESLTPPGPTQRGDRLDNIAGLVIGIATLDTRARSRLTESQIQAVGDALPDYTTSAAEAGQDPTVLWRNLDPSVFPTGASEGLRFYSRVLLFQK